MQHIASYVIVALITSALWAGILLHKLNEHNSLFYSTNIKYINVKTKLSNLQRQYNDLLFRFEILNQVRAPIPQDPITIALTVLGLSTDAGAQEIKNKYRSLVKQYHPDHNKSASASDKFKSINNAYQILTNRR